MKRFEIRLSKELHENLREESFITGKSMHEIVIELIEEHYKMKLVELNEGIRKELTEGTLQEIVDYLKDNPNLYTWQLDDDPEAEMPELDNVETLRELEHELDKIDLGWWTLAIE